MGANTDDRGTYPDLSTLIEEIPLLSGNSSLRSANEKFRRNKEMRITRFTIIVVAIVASAFGMWALNRVSKSNSEYRPGSRSDEATPARSGLKDS